MKLKMVLLGTIIWGYLCMTAMAQEIFKIAMTKSVNETFPEIRKTLKPIEQDNLAPGLISIIDEEIDSTRIGSDIKESLEDEEIQAVIGHSSSLVSFKNDPKFIIDPPKPNTLDSYFIILGTETVPNYLPDFAATNAIFYSEEYYLKRFVNLLKKCLFENEDRPALYGSSNGDVPGSFLNKIPAILIKACGMSVVYPSRYYNKLFEEEQGLFFPTNYFLENENQRNLIPCLNEKSVGLGDDPYYDFRELKIHKILKVLEKLQLDDRFKKDYKSVQTIRRMEGVQCVFLRKHKDFHAKMLRYLQVRYNQTRDFYWEEKKPALLKTLNSFAKTLFLLSEKENKEARLAFAEVHYRDARQLHRLWDESQGGEKRLIERINNGEVLKDYEFELAEAAIEEYERYFEFRPTDVRPDFMYLYAKNNQALLHSLRHRHYYNRGDCSQMSVRVDDCKKSNESEIAFKKLKQDLKNILKSPDSTYLKTKPIYKKFSRKFRNLFGEAPPD